MYCVIEKALFRILSGMRDRHPVGSHLVTEVGSIADAVGTCGMISRPEPRCTTHCGYAGASVRTAWRTRRPESTLQSVYDSPRTGTTLSLAYTGSCASADALIASAELSAEHPIDLDLSNDHSLITIGCGGILHVGPCSGWIEIAGLGLAHARVLSRLDRRARYSSLGRPLKARKGREMQLTAELRPLLLAILGAFADARIARMAAAESIQSPR